MDYLFHVDDSLIIAMVQVSLDLRYSRLYLQSDRLKLKVVCLYSWLPNH